MKKFRKVADTDGDAVAAADPSSIRNRRCIPVDLAASLVNLNLDPKVIIKVEDLPPGALLSCGQGNSNNSWSLKLEETNDVVFIAPQDDNSETFPLSIRVLMPDPDGFDYASTIHKFDILLSATATQSAFTAIQPEDGKSEPAQLGGLKDALAKARGLGDLKLTTKKALDFDDQSANAFESQRSSASLQALFSAEQKEEEDRRRLEDAEAEWRALEERRLAEARAQWMIETEAKLAQAVAQTRLQEEQKMFAAETRFREQLAEKREDAKARWKAKHASRSGDKGAPQVDVEAMLRIRMTTEETRLQQEAAQKVADAEAKFRKQLTERLESAHKGWQENEAARMVAVRAEWQAEEANRIGQLRLQWLGEIEAKAGDAKPATDEIEAVVKDRLAAVQAKWQRDALESLSQAETKWKEAEKARLDAARRDWQIETERRLQDVASAAPQVDVEAVVRERIASMQTRWQTEALSAISDAETRWKKAEKERIDAARKEWQEEKERILKDMATAVPAVDLESIVIERMRTAQGRWQQEALASLNEAEGRWKTEEAGRMKAARAEWQKELDQRVKDTGSVDIDVIVQKKVAGAQQKWQEEFVKVLEDTEKRWKAGEADRLKEAQAQWERNSGKSAGSSAASSADIEKQVKQRLAAELAITEAAWRTEEGQRLKAAEKDWSREAEKKYATLELLHIEDLQKLHAAEAKLVELRGSGSKDAKAQRAAEQDRLVAAEKEWAATAEKRLKSAEADWKAGEQQRLQVAEASWKAAEAKRLEAARAEWLAAAPPPRADTIDSAVLDQHIKAAEAAWKIAEEKRLRDAEATWRDAEQKRLDDAHVLWQSQTERRFSLIEKQVKDYQTQQVGLTERQITEKLAVAAETWKIEEAARLSAARAAWEAERQNAAAAPEQLAAQEEKIRIRVADELVAAQRFWQEAADLKLEAARAQWQAETERRIAEA